MESLLAHDRQAEIFIEAPALEVAANLLVREEKQPIVGRMISHYRIVSPLGGGGMGVVYVAEDVRLGRQVAIKFIRDTPADRGRALSRFKREAEALSSLDHPNICTQKWCRGCNFGRL